ncbi:MAG: hypothetical protein HOI95_03730, partial [Chromatiales bacterium]|nr:hypothetical protein [Chromatiales bacterium]
LAIAVLGIVATIAFGSALDGYLIDANISQGAIQSLAGERAKLGGMQLPDGFPEAFAQVARQAIRLAFRDAFATVCYVSAGLCLGSSFLGFWSTRTSQPPRAPNV